MISAKSTWAFFSMLGVLYLVKGDVIAAAVAAAVAFFFALLSDDKPWSPP